MRRRDILFSCAAGAAFAVWLASLAFPSPDVVVEVLDVGQGDAILVRSGRDEVLIDAGPDGSVLSGLGRSMPLFDRHIEYAVVTHPHLDHYGGMKGVLDRYSVGTVIAVDHPAAKGRYREVLRAADGAGAERLDVRRGFSFAAGAASFVMLHPFRGVPLPSDENASSLVIRMDVRGRPAALFMGDAPASVEDALLAAGGLPAAPFLKVAHHGSAGSTSVRFLEEVRPAVAAISVGRNGYGHPAAGTLRRLATAGVRTFRTDADGGIRARFSPGSLRVWLRGPLFWREAGRFATP